MVKEGFILNTFIRRWMAFPTCGYSSDLLSRLQVSLSWSMLTVDIGGFHYNIFKGRYIIKKTLLSLSYVIVLTACFKVVLLIIQPL